MYYPSGVDEPICDPAYCTYCGEASDTDICARCQYQVARDAAPTQVLTTNTPELYCEVCNADASNQTSIARWHAMNVCLDCIASHDELEQEEFFTAAIVCDESSIMKASTSTTRAEPLSRLAWTATPAPNDSIP